MSEFSQFSRVASEGETCIEATSEIRASMNEEARTARFDITVNDNQHRVVEISFLFQELEGKLALVRTGDPVTDYGLCVARKVGGRLGVAAWDCHQESDSWRAFFSCLKRKAPGIGIAAAWALLSCTGSIVGLDWD